MKQFKILVSLMLIFGLATTSFAYGPHRPPPPKHHHNSHSYYSRSNARDAVLVLLGIATITGIAIAASSSASKSKKAIQKEINERVEEKEREMKEKYEELAKSLVLSTEQQEQVNTLFDTNRAKIEPIREQKDLKVIELEEEKAKENPNETTINRLENEVSALSRDIYRITNSTRESLKTILTPAQYENMKDVQL